MRLKVRQIFDNSPHWVHDFTHVKRVVYYGRKIAKAEGLDSENQFLVELACWLHDLGRTLETKPTAYGQKFNHALESEKMAREILKSDVIPDRLKAGSGIYKKIIDIDSGSEAGMTKNDIESVLQAVAEHNQPTPLHPGNLITRILMDADRGEGFGYRGMVLVFNYNQVIDTGRVVSEKACRKKFLENAASIKTNKEKWVQAVHWLQYLANWYTGSGGDGVICPLYSASAKKIFRKRYLITKRWLEIFKKS